METISHFTLSIKNNYNVIVILYYVLFASITIIAGNIIRYKKLSQQGNRYGRKSTHVSNNGKGLVTGVDSRVRFTHGSLRVGWVGGW